MNSQLSAKSLRSNFAQVYGSPGEAPRVLGVLRAFWPLMVICLMSGYLLRAIMPWPRLSLSVVGVLFLLLALVTCGLYVRGSQRLKNYLKGAKGEEWVAHELAFLSSDYSVFNGFHLCEGKQSFDHVIVGPSGIFVVETKHWNGAVEFRDGRLFCNGIEPSRPPLRQVKNATAELILFLQEGGLTLPVQSVLCFISTELPEEVMNVSGVIVCTGERLSTVLQEPVGESLALDHRESVVHFLKKSF